MLEMSHRDSTGFNWIAREQQNSFRKTKNLSIQIGSTKPARLRLTGSQFLTYSRISGSGVRYMRNVPMTIDVPMMIDLRSWATAKLPLAISSQTLNFGVRKSKIK